MLNALLLRFVNFYDVENDVWKIFIGSISISVLKYVIGFNDFYDVYISYCVGLKKLMRDDSNIMVLI